MFFFRRIFKQLLLTAVIGFVVRKLMASDNPRAKQVGHQANRVLGGLVGLDETGRRMPRSRRRGAAKSAGSALVGGAFSYFFDPVQGADRRVRAKSFATTKLGRSTNGTNGSSDQLPGRRFDAGQPATVPHAGGGTIG